MLDSLQSLFNLKQKDGESLQDYTKRFKTTRDVLRYHIGGPIILTKYVERMKITTQLTAIRLHCVKKKHFNNLLHIRI